MSDPRVKHVAIIMDGNGRWANQRNLPRYHGHAAGANAVQRAINAAIKNKISYLSLFALSSENTLRPKKELTFLNNIFYKNITERLGELHSNNIKINFIGDLTFFSDKINAKMQEAVILTKNNTGLVFTVALNYGGRWDILQACNNIISDRLSEQNDIQVAINEDIFNKYISTYNVPEPDLLIRTGGERRISNFFIWQLAYTELFFSNTYWPDFCENDFETALVDYSNRKRKFGMIEMELA